METKNVIQKSAPNFAENYIRYFPLNQIPVDALGENLMRTQKIFERPIQSYEMDYFQYLPPSNLMRLTANAAFSALRDYGYNYLDLMREMGATWMMGMVDMEILKDVSVTREDMNLCLYASPLHRAPAVFMLRIFATLDRELISQTDVCVMVVSFKERRAIPTEEVVAHFAPPENEIVLPSPNRLILPGEMEHVFDQPIRYFDCDRNRHLNAYRYVDYICQAAGYWDSGEHKKARSLRVEYDSECLPGETLSIYKKETEDGIFVKGVKSNGRLSFKSVLKMEP